MLLAVRGGRRISVLGARVLPMLAGGEKRLLYVQRGILGELGDGAYFPRSRDRATDIRGVSVRVKELGWRAMEKSLDGLGREISLCRAPRRGGGLEVLSQVTADAELCNVHRGEGRSPQ